MKKLMFFFISIPLTATLLFASEFKVNNGSDQAIEKILVQESGTGSWRPFNLGKPIAPGKARVLTWSDSTADSDCNWSIKAVFEDGSESEPDEFDFCEEDLEISFE